MANADFFESQDSPSKVQTTVLQYLHLPVALSFFRIEAAATFEKIGNQDK
jgi:hypothetical protein